MNSQIDLRGASGALYRYRQANPVRPNIAGGGNFIYVRAAEGTAVVVYAGETDSFFNGGFERWDEAVRQHGATHVFTRLNVSGARRSQELDDILPVLGPVMNDGVSAN
jgi:hypothetical protein